MDFPDRFARHDIFALPPADRAAAADALGLPWFEVCLDSIALLQATAPGGLVRGYLIDLVTGGSFALRSPVTGRVLRSGASLLLVDKTVLFSFPDEPEIMLGVGDISDGYPVCALLVTGPALFLPVADNLWGFAERHLGWAADAIRDTGWSIVPAQGALTLVIGDTNFAHYAWNQLSALHDLPRGSLRDDIRIVATQQPLGPVHAILPDLPPWPVQALPDTALQALNRPGQVFAPMGAHLLTASLCARIHSFAAAHLSPAARVVDAALRAAGPVLWISVRTRNRTATNQHDVLLALGRRFLDAVPGGVLLIDSFSVADDVAAYPSYHQEEAAEVLAADRAAVGLLHAALDLHHPGRTLAATGLTVSDSIALARHADLYFCHHGTVQHKIGWFNATPGVVHSNRAMLATSPSHWVAAQSEVAVPPVYLAPEMVADAADDPPGAATYARLLRHENYTITDIPAAIDAVLALADQAGLLTKPDPADQAGLLTQPRPEHIWTRLRRMWRRRPAHPRTEHP